MSDAKIAGAPADKQEELQAQAAAEAQQKAQEAAAAQAAQAQAAKLQAQEARRAEEQARQQRELAPKTVVPAEPEKHANGRAALEEAAALREMAEKERDRLRELGNEYDARLRRERNRDRIEALRGMGALGSLTDEQLLAITPDADPHTAGGKAQLAEWRERNEGLFVSQEGPKIPTPADLMEGLTTQKSASGLYDEKFLAKMLRDNLGRG